MILLAVKNQLHKFASRSKNLEGKTKVKGIEITYKGKIADNLISYANYTYTNIKNGESKLGANGKTLDRRPKHTANVGLAYQITEKLGSDVNISYIGKRLDTYWGTYPSKHKVKCHLIHF